MSSRGHFPWSLTSGGGDRRVKEQKDCGGGVSSLTTGAVRRGHLEEESFVPGLHE